MNKHYGILIAAIIIISGTKVISSEEEKKDNGLEYIIKEYEKSIKKSNEEFDKGLKESFEVIQKDLSSAGINTHEGETIFESLKNVCTILDQQSNTKPVLFDKVKDFSQDEEQSYKLMAQEEQKKLVAALGNAVPVFNAKIKELEGRTEEAASQDVKIYSKLITFFDTRAKPSLSDSESPYKKRKTSPVKEAESTDIVLSNNNNTRFPTQENKFQSHLEENNEDSFKENK